MSECRYAVLIAASQFPEEPKLLPLRAPENDVDGLNEVLGSKDLGGFTDVAVLKNEFSHVVHRKILRVLRQADKDDFVLIYYSGHGKLDLSGRLHLATKDTTIDDLEATSISPMRIRESVENTHCNKVVLILDCCFSGAVGRVFARGNLDEQFQLVSGGRGTYIMTASTAIQIAQEKEDDQYGLFTKYLIEGIRTGAADRDEDGNVTVDELYRYVHKRMLDEGFQEPMKWDLNVRGELVIARTGKSPREDRRRAIRLRLTDLYSQGNLPLRVLTEALALNDKQSSDDSSLQRRQLLDQLLLQEKLRVGDFIEAWYEAASIQTSTPTLGSRALEPGVEAEKTEPPGPEKAEKEAGARRTAEDEAVALRKAEEKPAVLPKVKEKEEEAAVLHTPNLGRPQKIIVAVFGAAILLGIVLYAAFNGPTNLLIETDPSGAEVSVGSQTCQTPCSLKLSPGSYQMEAKHDGYQPYSQSLSVTAETKSPLMLQLKPSLPPASETKWPVLQWKPWTSPSTSDAVGGDALIQEKGCNSGDAAACYHLGYMYDKGNGVGKDQARAAQLYKQACDGGNAKGCTNLGNNYLNGEGVGKDPVRAAQLYKKGCDGGNFLGCDNLGWMYEAGEGVAKDQARAVQLYKQACDGRDSVGCSYLGDMYEYGKGVGIDPARAVQLYKQGCDGGNAWGCSSLGSMYARGKGVGEEPARAVQLYKQGCDGGDAYGCAGLGWGYEYGKGVGEDQARAVQLYKQACEHDYFSGCTSLGFMYSHGKGVGEDQARAVQLYKQACDHGDARGCYNLGTRYENGMGVGKDLARAAQLYKQACDGGYADACKMNGQSSK